MRPSRIPRERSARMTLPSRLVTHRGVPLVGNLSRFYVRLAAILVAIIPFSSIAYGEDASAIRRRNAPAIVFINATVVLPNNLTDSVVGTGFIVDGTGFVLTCNHVLPSAQTSFPETALTGIVGGRYGISYPLSIVKREPELDLALLKLPALNEPWPTVTLDHTETIHLDLNVYAMGFPGARELDGVPGSVRSSAAGGRWVVTAPIDRGSSGGPVTSEKGDVIAIAVGGYEGAVLQNLIVPISFAKGLLLFVTGAAGLAAAPTTSVTVTRLISAEASLADLPEEMREPGPSGLSAAALELDLRNRGSLELRGTHLIVGAVGANAALTLRVHTLTLAGNARIVTNGNSLRIVAWKIRVDSGSIVSFEEPGRVALAGQPGQPGTSGRSGGEVRFDRTAVIEGLLPVQLLGQNGGAGGVGLTGTDGAPGARGADAVSGLFDCRSGGANGAPGGRGQPGARGGTGGSGGAGGRLILVEVSPQQAKAIVSTLSGGVGGVGGPGGPGGRGGPGGQGGSGAGFCRGGAAGLSGEDGVPGDHGPQGPDGPSGSSAMATS
jgi:Trypsin-like peptidase domain